MLDKKLTDGIFTREPRDFEVMSDSSIDGDIEVKVIGEESIREAESNNYTRKK